MSYKYKVIVLPGDRAEHDLGQHTFQNPVHKQETLIILGNGDYLVENVIHQGGVIGYSVLHVTEVKKVAWREQAPQARSS